MTPQDNIANGIIKFNNKKKKYQRYALYTGIAGAASLVIGATVGGILQNQNKDDEESRDYKNGTAIIGVGVSVGLLSVAASGVLLGIAYTPIRVTNSFVNPDGSITTANTIIGNRFSISN
jgi:hypothetical protein